MKRLIGKLLELLEKVLLPPFPAAADPENDSYCEPNLYFTEFGPWFGFERFFLGL